MTVNELMIGNIVEYNDTSMTVLGIMGNTVILDGVNSLIDIELISPVVLSEEMLSVIGFESSFVGDSREYSKGGFRINHIFKGELEGKVYISFSGVKYENYDAIKYVHRIQNLITTTS
jgi:hypothetical protein